MWYRGRTGEESEGEKTYGNGNSREDDIRKVTRTSRPHGTEKNKRMETKEG